MRKILGSTCSLVASALLVGGLVACGPTGRSTVDGNGGDGGNVDAFVPQTATLTGKVWAPNQGPGQAAPGQEIPIYGALVYLTKTKPDAIPQNAYCEKCVDTPAGGVLSSHDGSFSLSAAPGTYWLVVQKGQFRIEQQINVVDGATALTAAQTTLPSKNDPANGAWIPKIAIVRGFSDNIQDVMGKLGFGTMGGNTWSSPMGEAGPEMTMYQYNASGADLDVNLLFNNIEEMRKYHIIFFPCATSMGSYDSTLRDQNKLKNIRQFVKEGGKLYVTDWSGEVADRAFPQQIELGDSGADSNGTYDPATLTGTLTTVGDSDGAYYDNDDGRAVDPNLGMWLGLQVGPTEANATPAMYNSQRFPITHNYNWVKSLKSVSIGLDPNGVPVIDEPKAWVAGTTPAAGGQHPQAVTYTPTGCGKVLYSTFQTSNTAHAGMYPQERVLLYLIMEIQQCSEVIVE
ncbi:MAG TPA: hypothetical protein PLF40_18310 [Kofleriaceae bacterium]|nr:hypothetical protein [Kofleriaceae bacterium]